MKVKTLLIILLITGCCYTQSEKVYFGELLKDKTIRLEDQYTFLENQHLWGKDEFGIDYDKYYQHIINIVKSNVQNYSDTVYEYIINYHVPEMNQLTNIKIGDKFYVATESGVKSSEVIGYNIDFHEIIGGGIMFYPQLKSVGDEEREIVLISTENSISKIIWDNVTDKTVINSFKKFILPKIKHIKIIEGEDAGKKIKSIKDDEIKVLKGSFTRKYAEEYLVSWCKRISFDSYACVTYVMDINGSVIKTVFKLQETEFSYTNVLAICDINSDSIDEIITKEGYYEGHGWVLWKLEGNEWKLLTSGFYFGV